MPSFWRGVGGEALSLSLEGLGVRLLDFPLFTFSPDETSTTNDNTVVTIQR